VTHLAKLTFQFSKRDFKGGVAMVWAVSGPVCPSGHDSRVKQIKAGKQLQLSRSFKPQKTTSEAIPLPYPTSTPWFGTLRGETS